MSIWERVKEFCFLIASCYELGKFTGSGIFVSFLAIPLIMVTRLIAMVVPWPHIMFFAFLIFSYIVIQLSLGASSVKCEVYGVEDPELSLKRKSYIILNKIVGMVIALWGISISLNNWRVLLLGFAIFHALSFLKPMVLINDFLKRLDKLPGAVGFLTYDIVFGIATNVILRILTLVS